MLRDLMPIGQCQLQYVSATQIALAPFNGCLIKIAGAPYQIPSGGVTAANTSVYVNGTAGQNLAASTTYLVGLAVISGTLTVGFFALGTYARVSDTTAGNIGVEVISSGGTPQSAWTLIGMVQTNGSSQFQNGGPFVGVISWFNRTDRRPFASTTPVFSSTSYAEISTALRVSFLCWADDTPWGVCDGQWQVLNQPMTINLQSSVDGIQYGSNVANAFTANSAPASFSSHWTVDLTEGWHTSSPYGLVSSGTAEADAYNWANVRG